ncbi:hypothetical protein KAJ27_09280, partial [bacterium]|nr:hypothetical protein [bacterium]
MNSGPNRSTQEQIHLRKCTKALFAIYNNVITKTNLSGLNPLFLHLEIKNLLSLIFKKEFTYDEEDNPNLFSAAHCKKNIAREDILKGHVDSGIECMDFGTAVFASEKELRKTPELITMLMTDKQNRIKHHFVLGSESKIIENSIALSTNPQDQKKREYIGTTENIDDTQDIIFSQDLKWNEINKRKKSVE